MKPFDRALVGTIAYTMLLTGMFMMAMAIIQGPDSLDVFRRLAIQPIGFLGAVVVLALMVSMSYYLSAPWSYLAGRIEKLHISSRKSRYELDEVTIAKLVEDTYKELEEVKSSHDILKSESAELREKAEYIEQTEKALLNILEDVEEANSKLQELDQLKTDFLNITSHELRTPLTPIIAYADMIEKGRLGPLTDEQKSGLVVVRRNALRLRLLISDILDIAKLEGRRMKYVMEKHNVNRLIMAAVSDQQALARSRNISIAVDEMPRIPRLKVDGSRIMQVLTNLIHNAIKFSPEGGRVRIKARLSGREIVVSIADRGIGIPADDLPKLFNMFFQSRRTMTRNQEGSGLGLAICKWIVEDHGGRIWVSSRVGEGSTFSFALPLKYSPRTTNIVGSLSEVSTVDEVRNGMRKIDNYTGRDGGGVGGE